MNKIVFIFIFLMLPLSAQAAPEFSSENRGPVEVTSDRLEVDDLAQTLVFIGNAVAT
jgi:lipopolysaccharide export system protein LptA